MKNEFVGVSAEYIREVISEIESLLVEKEDIQGRITLAYSDAKAHGVNIKVLRNLIKLRKLAKDERDQIEMLTNEYMNLLGMN
jgi:uncharacterized protein (UPF0335 family)